MIKFIVSRLGGTHVIVMYVENNVSMNEFKKMIASSFGMNVEDINKLYERDQKDNELMEILDKFFAYVENEARLEFSTLTTA